MLRYSLRKLGNFLISFGETPRSKQSTLTSSNESSRMSSFEEKAEKLANEHSDILLGGSIQLIGLNTIIEESKKIILIL